jgi:PAS domain S-box-containing protein
MDDESHRRPSLGVARGGGRSGRRARAGDGAKKRFRALVDASPTLMLGLDSDGVIKLVNPAVEAASGLHRADLIGRRFEDLLAPSSEGVDGWTAEAPTERALRNARGGERRVEWRMVHDRPLAWVYGEDVTAARAAERRLRAVEQLAVVGELTGGLAHELRNPLNAAMLELTSLARRFRRAEGVDDLASVEVARRELGRIDRLLADFLWFARPLSATTQPGQLSSPAEAVARMVSAEVAARGITLSIDLDPAARPVAFDEDCIRQAIFNMVRNAIDALPGGGRIALRVLAAEETTELDVEDNGPGIAGDPAKVFAPFYSTRPWGTGLGLTIARRIATDHGGEVRVQSAPGRTVFTLALPAIDP